MKFCSNCGQALPAGVKFCPKCGQAIGEASAAEAQPTTAPTLAATNAPTTAATTTAPTSAPTVAPVSNNYRTADQPDQPQLGFVGSVQYSLQHVFEFNGNVPESRKSVFWWTYLAAVIVMSILVFIPVIGAPLAYAARILLVSAMMRRLTYINQNPGLAWLGLIPVVELYPYILMFLDRKAA
ncbi:hypothetical protein LFAB_15445 [Lactiplantibacillus fabifermentans T30PCM01]|uniref:Zinc-ribbon domain-containing protein n=1 Tax=Lactiplantibacillus fabifermentans T30PCM01 TaxID=1400520 RepID=W6T4Y5_9LACO|nr:zinc ribbon domain-containing protein [Lactiplantibacillus fabifermentans]ETY72848.1 hypothetical protein LFAB_15445 [Lactiplantibacillus fabifermentans T30PCM01]